MYIICLATDYDGTLAHDGAVDVPTIEALEAFRRSGRKLVMVTGRELPDLFRVFPRTDLFDRIVAENGALLYTPATKKERPLAPEPPAAFVERLKAEGVAPLSVGRSIVATWEPHEKAVLAAIRDLGLELQIIFNKGAVMVLPAGVNKATGLKAALDDLGLSAHNVVAAGDAENDHAFMQASGFSVAVANALPSVKEGADLVTRGARGAGVTELIEAVIAGDVGAFGDIQEHSAVEIGTDGAGAPVKINPHGGGALIAGLSSGGKSTLATAFIERFQARGFQVCVFDPEGDYAGLRSAVVIGDAKTPPRMVEAMKALERPQESVVVDMLSVSIEDRPALFSQGLAAVSELRGRTGRPHWVLVDESHHVLPAERDASITALPPNLPATIFVTVDPGKLAPDVLGRVDDVFAVGAKAEETVRAFCRALGIAAPDLPQRRAEDQTILWRRRAGSPQLFVSHPPAEKSERHTRKYAEGELGHDKSFFFRGPDGALKLRAQNLTLFLQIADGVDDATWRHHLDAHDYSRWMREAIKDEDLAAEVQEIEDASGDPAETRRRVRDAVERRYTAPADSVPPLGAGAP
ncbi:MAG: HAD-IIB family hydrolase [Caulobacteraceae bacterium]|nr:HAD-IIB family hydrolase [Caulobacteraceae bacterium]